MKVVAILLLTVISCSNLYAKPKTKNFPASPDLVFKVAMKVVAKKYMVKYADKETRILNFTSPAGLLTGEYEGMVSVESDDKGGSVVSIQTKGPGARFGGAGYVAKKIFEQIGEDLAKTPARSHPLNPEQSPPQESEK